MVFTRAGTGARMWCMEDRQMLRDWLDEDDDENDTPPNDPLDDADEQV